MKNARMDSVEASMDAAWTRFRRRLADRIADLDDGDSLIVELEGDDDDEELCTPYVQATSDDGRCGRAEVSSNRFLQPLHRLDKASRRRLRELGWARPSSRPDTENYSVDFDLAHADQVAVMMVRALRDVFGVVHPAFLIGHRIELDDEASPAVDEPDSSWAEEPLAVEPTDSEELDRLVEEALAPVFGHPPTRDPDGDIGMTNGSAVVFVRLLPGQPMIDIFAELAVEVTEPERARFEVAVLNRDWKLAKFVLVGDVVQAHTYVPALPFAPEHLRSALAMMCEMADTVDDDLAFRVGGRTFLDPSDAGFSDTADA